MAFATLWTAMLLLVLCSVSLDSALAVRGRQPKRIPAGPWLTKSGGAPTRLHSLPRHLLARLFERSTPFDYPLSFPAGSRERREVNSGKCGLPDGRMLERKSVSVLWGEGGGGGLGICCLCGNGLQSTDHLVPPPPSCSKSCQRRQSRSRQCGLVEM